MYIGTRKKIFVLSKDESAPPLSMAEKNNSCYLKFEHQILMEMELEMNVTMTRFSKYFQQAIGS